MIFTNTSVDLVLPVGTRDHSQGMLAAPIVLVEYIDYQCPYCAQAVSIVRELQYELGERLCYIVRHFPLVDLHLQAMRAAEATEAAAAQNQFWQMHYSLIVKVNAPKTKKITLVSSSWLIPLAIVTKRRALSLKNSVS